jgi:hypothetical protein
LLSSYVAKGLESAGVIRCIIVSPDGGVHLVTITVTFYAISLLVLPSASDVDML